MSARLPCVMILCALNSAAVVSAARCRDQVVVSRSAGSVGERQVSSTRASLQTETCNVWVVVSVEHVMLSCQAARLQLCACSASKQ